MKCYVRDYHLFTNTKTDLTNNEAVHNRFFKLKTDKLNKHSHYIQNLFVLLSESGLFDMLHFTRVCYILQGCAPD